MERKDIIPALRAIHDALEILAYHVKRLSGDRATVAEEIDGELRGVKEAVEWMEREARR
jgi:hypothetical protein